jgi:hypothetical protein
MQLGSTGLGRNATAKEEVLAWPLGWLSKTQEVRSRLREAPSLAVVQVRMR